jgi:hypothetical protein
MRDVISEFKAGLLVELVDAIRAILAIHAHERAWSEWCNPSFSPRLAPPTSTN